MRHLALTTTLLGPLALGGCCVSPFVDTATHVAPDEPGSPAREVGTTLEESPPAIQSRGPGDGRGAGFDMRLVRVQPGIHLGTEQACDVGAAGRLEALDDDDAERYAEAATHRMSVLCVAPTGESWADLAFTATNVSHAGEVVRGVRIRVRVQSADGGFSDYPIVDYVGGAGDAELGGRGGRTPSAPTSVPTGFDLRQVQREPSLIGSTQPCAVSHVGDIDILETRDVRRRSYPAGVQNRMTVRCRHSSGEEWADLVFMPSVARSALHIRRGDVVPVVVVSRAGGFFDYPVVQFAGE